MNTSGVYAILCIATRKIYVGSSSRSMSRRWKEHKDKLNRGNHVNKYLQNAWNKYKRFKFFVLETCSPLECLTIEQKYIDLYKSANPKFGFNRLPIAGSALGVRHSKETKQKIAFSHKRLMKKKEYREIVLQNLHGKKSVKKKMAAYNTQEYKQKRSEIMRKWWTVSENRKNYRGNKGKVTSQETKKKISRSLRGHQAWNKGISPSEETRRKISLSLIGRVSPTKGIKLTAKQKKALSERNTLAYLRNHLEKLIFIAG